MAPHVCPWWLAYFFDIPGRRLLQNPKKICRPYVREGMTALDLGCGLGFSTIDLARLVGPSGKVLAVDLQPRMLSGLARRAKRAGLADRIETRLCGPDDLGLSEAADFAIAFNVVHEASDQTAFLAQVSRALKPGACFLIVEPSFHISEDDLLATIALADKIGLKEVSRPRIVWSRAVVLSNRGATL
ncbi:MAG: class I SAM-dependent methyltransferase [Deltaproteobacteria bacterium]|nr:class I SAM-dependent methyltransferase [Deltaproteobacteria bacterium]